MEPSPSSAPGFFVVGTGRCGSTIVRKLLRQHPLVYIPKETHWIPVLFDRYGLRPIAAGEFIGAAASVYMAKGKTALDRILGENGLDRSDLASALSDLSERSAPAWTEALYRWLARANGASIWGDKTPDYGHCMSLLAGLYPGARFVHIARDGRDVALSMHEVLSFRYLAAWGLNYWEAICWERAYEARREVAEAPIDIDEFYRLWRSRLLRTRDEATRLPPAAYLEIRYEDLLRDPRRELTRVESFLALPPPHDWIDRAAAMIRPGNLGKNADRDEHRALTRRYRDDLDALGFEV